MRRKGMVISMKNTDRPIVIDCFKLVKGAGKSIGIYNLALNLTRNLSVYIKTLDKSEQKRIVVLGNSKNRKDFDIEGVEFREINKNPLDKITCILWELFEVSILAKKLNAEKILYPRGYASMLHLTKEQVIIHDMIPFFYDENFPGVLGRFENFYIMWRLKASARKADKVITISEASKKDILKYAGDVSDKITVINNGYNGIKNCDKYICDNFEEKKDYIISVTSTLPHKNAAGIIDAYVEYCKMETEPLPLKIVGIGGLEDIANQELKQVPDKKILDKITFIKYIESNEEFYKLIAEAKIFLFLSLIEGFGFPPVEAMQLGTPVICSGNSSLPEVVGDAAVLVNPDDSKSVGVEISKLLNDMQTYNTLVQKGFINAKRFSWDEIIVKYWESLVK